MVFPLPDTQGHCRVPWGDHPAGLGHSPLPPKWKVDKTVDHEVGFSGRAEAKIVMR